MIVIKYNLLTKKLDSRLEHFRTQHELARNFYDDYEFCPVNYIEEVTEHRERVQKRTSPYPSPNHSPPPSYYIAPNHHRHQNSSPTAISTRAIPIIDPSNMTPVSVPVHQQYPVKSNTPSMAQWVAYKNTSPTSSNSSISSISSSSSGNSSGNSHCYNYYPSSNCAINYNQQPPHFQQQQPAIPVVARGIPIIDPATRQAFRQQQQSPNIPPGFYNVS
ncbi:hypothetical protein INT47_004976, partial [Mucor saturninus]